VGAIYLMLMTQALSVPVSHLNYHNITKTKLYVFVLNNLIK